LSTPAEETSLAVVARRGQAQLTVARSRRLIDAVYAAI
jgi:hypothetical protein